MVWGEKFEKRIDGYRQDFLKYGYSPLSLAMPSDRRTIRYYELIKNFSFYENKDEMFCILDAGCGFGDLSAYLNQKWDNCRYIGIDVVEEFVSTAKERYASKNTEFHVMNYFSDELPVDLIFDYAVLSQTFNDLYTIENDNFEIIRNVISKLFASCRKGVSFNFFTNKVQYKKENTAYHSPERILSMAYELSNAVVLDNSCMPYECTCSILKDRASDGMIFDMFREKHAIEFADGTFVVNRK